MPKITESLTIAGPSDHNLTIDGGGSYALFNVASGTTVAIAGLTIANGSVSGNGSRINDAGSLAVSDCVISNCYAVSGNGGGIYFDGTHGGTLAVSRCTFDADDADGMGGGIYTSATARRPLP